MAESFVCNLITFPEFTSADCFIENKHRQLLKCGSNLSLKDKNSSALNQIEVEPVKECHVNSVTHYNVDVSSSSF